VTAFVSVIIPTHDRAVLCRRAVASVLAQTHGDLEVIVVDDGSRDGTREAVEGMDPRVRYIWQENAGVAAARNRGMAAARGEFIALLDSDDLFLPWKIEAQLAAMRFFPRAGMVWTDMVAVDPQG
jgi:glycosyltransferase involved in cell wall biosynthesis